MFILCLATPRCNCGAFDLGPKYPGASNGFKRRMTRVIPQLVVAVNIKNFSTIAGVRIVLSVFSRGIEVRK